MNKIASYKPVGMRLRLEEGPGGDDAYNANPMSVEANLRMLAAIPGRRRVALLGDMLELGPQKSNSTEIRRTRPFLGTRPDRLRRPPLCAAIGDSHICAPDAEQLGKQLTGYSTQETSFSSKGVAACEWS